MAQKENITSVTINTNMNSVVEQYGTAGLNTVRRSLAEAIEDFEGQEKALRIDALIADYRNAGIKVTLDGMLVPPLRKDSPPLKKRELPDDFLLEGVPVGGFQKAAPPKTGPYDTGALLGLDPQDYKK